MKPFTQLQAIAAVLDQTNVDTDAIIPKQFLKSIKRTGFGKNLFHESRYLDAEGTQENPDFVLNLPRYQGAEILVTRPNFGCGSSREHAPWALLEYGFRCIIAPSFADIFFNNCFKNGILPVVLSEEKVQALFEEIEANEGTELTIDLASQTVQTPAGQKEHFEVDSFLKEKLLAGLDDIGWTLKFAEQIQSFEDRYRTKEPWMFAQEHQIA